MQGVRLKRFVDAHRDWWELQHKDEPADLPAMGLFKAFRNFVHHLLKARQEAPIGVEWAIPVGEAFGDMFMYCFSCYNSLRTQPPELLKQEYALRRSAEECAAMLADSFSAVLGNIVGGLKPDMQFVLGCIECACQSCGLNPEEVLEAAIKKLERKRCSRSCRIQGLGRICWRS
jgi:hypothetical protein